MENSLYKQIDNELSTLQPKDYWVGELYDYICEAERQGKWLENKYYNLKFSPEELVKEILRGRFRWGKVNWVYIDRPQT